MQGAILLHVALLRKMNATAPRASSLGEKGRTLQRNLHNVRKGWERIAITG